MPVVHTALGPVDVATLGPTLMHEHIFSIHHEMQANYDTGWSEEAACEAAVARLQELAAAGIGSLVDLTVLGIGRYVPRVVQIARQVQVNVIVATGLYTFNEVPHHFMLKDADSMADLFVDDIVHGIHGTDGVRAAILKCATDSLGVTEGVEQVLRAVARAHRQTGAPITTHTDATRQRGLEQQRIFREEGVDLRRVIIGHSGDSTDLEYLQSMLDAGSYLGMDRFGLNSPITFSQRVGIVATLCEKGYAGQLVLSHDAACHADQMGPKLIRKLQERGWGYTHISRDVVPALLDAGVTREQIDTMLIDNPRRIFATEGGY